MEIITEPQSVIKANVEDTMQSAYLEYAMSVIIGRALPDVRDGLKPVHRRILYAMHTMNLAYNRPYVKSARVVGEVIGKYHPHGDSAVYDAAVRLAQNFSMRYPLIDGQGNFGSIDGDSPAAMRYTEMRLKKISQDILVDMEKETVDFTPNYDDSLQEPSVLPTKVPLLLINGSTGIAVGMATNIPPHNLSEIVDGLLYLIDHRTDCTLEDLIPLIQGPDFPTAGIILGRKGIMNAFATGRGSIPVRARTNIEPVKGSNGREAIIVTELPYMVNKANLIEKIADLIKEKRLEGISDIRDESDRRGMRIVIELKRNEIPDHILMNLYKYTQMQNNFGVIMLAVVNGLPRVLPLLDVLKLFLEHRIEVIVRRTRFNLTKAQERAHILEGLKTALDNIDAIIKLIRGSEEGKIAKERLKKEFELSDLQAQAILDMRLQRLTGLERDKLENELKELLAKIKYYQDVLNNDSMQFDIVKAELEEVKSLYGEARRTEIVEDEGDIQAEDLIPVEDMVITISREGYIKRCQLTSYSTQHRGGKGKMGMKTKEEDDIEQLFIASSHDTLLIFTNTGKVYWKKVYTLPLSTPSGKGRAVINLLALSPEEKICVCLPISEYNENQSLVLITQNGIIKRTPLTDYQHERSKGSKAIIIDENDSLITASLCREDDLIFISTYLGMSLKLPANKIRTQGRATRGCKGITLHQAEKSHERDYVVAMVITSEEGLLLTITEKGYGKRTPMKNYRLGSRANKGVRNLKLSGKNGAVIGTLLAENDDEIMLITKSGKIIRLHANQIRISDRITQGVKLIDLESDEIVVAAAKVIIQ